MEVSFESPVPQLWDPLSYSLILILKSHFISYIYFNKYLFQYFILISDCKAETDKITCFPSKSEFLHKLHCNIEEFLSNPLQDLIDHDIFFSNQNLHQGPKSVFQA